MTPRRRILVLAVLLLGLLSTGRAHANRDPNELSVGGSLGAHDAHFACAPDVRVHHASGGFHYERVFTETRGLPEGAIFDVRAGVGPTTIVEVDGPQVEASGAPNRP